MTDPHSSWAEYYDTVYKESFGFFYGDLTKATLEVIRVCLEPPARIVDFGAGTGRLSIPLAELGYDVEAVDPCRPMLEQLKSKTGGEEINIVNCLMQDFQSEKKFDMALCVFTVLTYILDDKSLKRSIQSAASALKPEGLLLIDIPSRYLFQSYSRKTQKIDRIVSIMPEDEVLYSYEESITVKCDDGNIVTSDRFTIRYWDPEHVIDVLGRNGFSVLKDLSSTFAGTGSQYFLFKKD